MCLFYFEICFVIPGLACNRLQALLLVFPGRAGKQANLKASRETVCVLERMILEGCVTARVPCVPLAGIGERGPGSAVRG